MALNNVGYDEKKKIKQVLEEKGKEKDMPWMYSKAKPDTEEYLMGKRVDKAFETQDEPPPTTAPGDPFSERAVARAHIDMQAKMREDPLFMIRKKEEDQRRRLLENPVKMKRLQEALEKRAASKRSKKKKEKKHKKKKHQSDSDADSDDELMKKYLAILNKKKKSGGGSEKRSRAASSGDSSSSDDESHNSRHSHNRSRKGDSKGRTEVDSGFRERQKPDVSSGRRYGAGSDDDKAPKQYGLIGGKVPSGSGSGSNKTSKSPQRQSPARRRSRSPRRRSRSPRRRSRSPTKNSRSSQGGSRRRSRSRSPAKKNVPKKKLSAEEMDRRRQEMMENARWRDEQRETKVNKYREDSKREEAEHRETKNDEFINSMMVEHAGKSSVEERIKRNKYNLQRTKAQLDRDFTKH